MGLGTNRDYKTRDRAAHINLKVHQILMDKYIKQGMDRAAASREALIELSAMTFKQRKQLVA